MGLSLARTVLTLDLGPGLTSQGPNCRTVPACGFCLFYLSVYICVQKCMGVCVYECECTDVHIYMCANACGGQRTNSTRAPCCCFFVFVWVFCFVLGFLFVFVVVVFRQRLSLT